MGDFYQELLALDIPVLLPLPRDLAASGCFGLWNAQTVHYLYVRFTGGTSAASELSYAEAFAVPIKIYDTLPLYRQFNEPVVETRRSADNQVVVELSIPVSSLGPRDPFVANARISANPLNNKRKKNLGLKQVTLHVKEILECFDGGLPTKKEHKLFTKTTEHDASLTTEGSLHEFSFRFPYENDYLQLYSPVEVDPLNMHVQQASATFNKNKHYGKIAPGIPLTHIQSFTTLGKLFSIRFELTLKVKIAHGKDVEIQVPLTVAPYDRCSCDYLLRWITTECQIARERFGREVVSTVVHTHNHDEVQLHLHRYCLPPITYRNNRADWARLGYNPSAFGKHAPDRALVEYID